MQQVSKKGTKETHTSTHTHINTSIQSSMSHYFTLHEFTRSATAERRGIDNTPPAAAREAINALIANVLDPLRRR